MRLTGLPGEKLWAELREKCGNSITEVYNHFLYKLTDDERNAVRPCLNLTLLLIWALAEPRGEQDGTRWTVDYVTKRVLG